MTFTARRWAPWQFAIDMFESKGLSGQASGGQLGLRYAGPGPAPSIKLSKSKPFSVT